MSESAKFWDKIAQRYSRSAVADESAYQQKLALTREQLEPDFELLELACGTGSTAIALADSVNHIHATDISQNMLDIARRKAEEAGVENVSFEQAAIGALQISADSYDAVLAHSILHLVGDRTGVIAQVYDWLKPGGVFVSSTICLGKSKLRFLRPVMFIASKFSLLPEIYVFSQRDLRTAITNAGFEIVHEWQPRAKSVLFIIARKPKQD